MRTEGRNLADPYISPTEKLFKSYAHKEGRESCVFISHASENKDAAVEIGEYIRRAGIDIYLDIYDEELQASVARGNDKGITNTIEKGVDNSTDILCIISDSTKNSWWVPYEIGYGKKSSNSISTLVLKNVDDIPSYLKILNNVKGIKGLNEYLQYLIDKEKKSYIEKTNLGIPNIMPHFDMDHPLSVYMNRTS